MGAFTVKWEVKVNANSAEEAAEEARAMQLNKESNDFVFKVEDARGSETSINLFNLPYEKYYRKLQAKIHEFDNSKILSSDLSDQAFEYEFSLLDAVQNYFSDNSIDISTLKPLKGEVKEFHDQVKELVRPYAKISEEQQSELLKAPFDFYETSGGLVVTFGGADGGYAIMPLNKDAAERIKSNQ